MKRIKCEGEIDIGIFLNKDDDKINGNGFIYFFKFLKIKVKF